MNPPSPSHHLVSTQTRFDHAERCVLQVVTSHMFSKDVSIIYFKELGVHFLKATFSHFLIFFIII